MRIRQKLQAGFLFISLLTIGISFGISLLVQNKTVNTFQEVGGEILPGNIALSRMTTELYHTIVLIDKYEDNRDDAILREIEQTLSRLDTHRTMHDLFHREDELSLKVEELIQEFSRSVAQYMLLLKKEENKETFIEVRHKIDALLEEFISSINPSIERDFEISYKKIADIQAINHQARWVLIVSSIIILTISLVLGFVIANLFATPLRKLRDAARLYGGGHLDVTIPVSSSDEIGDLALAFNEMGKNLTELRAEEKRLGQALNRTQKMDAIGKLTGGIAHDFNNMLGVIIGYSDLLLKKTESGSTAEKYAKQILRAGERAKILTAKLLSFSRKEVLSAEQTDINQQISESRHMLEKTLTPRITFVAEMENEIWPVKIDKASLEDAILNMCINSMHAIPEVGTVKITTQNIHLGSEDAHRINTAAGDYVLLTVSDTGKGMDQETLQQIFDPFFSTKGEFGTGLGMSQVYSFVQQSGGAIEVESEVGQGTRIYIYLPRYEDVATSILETDKTLPEKRLSGHETILVVDDEPALREFVREVLASHGYHVICAENGKQALEYIEKDSIDLMLSDVIMPNMDGYQLAALAEERHPKIKIQMISGFVDEQYVIRNEELHNRRLKKPFDAEELLLRIREFLDHKEAADEVSNLLPINWSSEIATGIEPMDKDHQILVSLLNSSISALEGGDEEVDLENTLSQLLNYANIHFKREEAIMAACNYPDLVAHKKSHRKLLEDVNSRILAFKLGNLNAALLIEFIRNWVINHIMKQDREIASFCQGKQNLIEQAIRDADQGHIKKGME